MNPLTDQTLIDAIFASIQLVVPEIVLVGSACVLFLLGLVFSSRALSVLLSLVALGVAAAVAVSMQATETSLSEAARQAQTGVYYTILGGPLADFTRYLTLAIGAVLVMLATKDATKPIAADYYACVLVVLAGTSLVGRCNDLITLYVALEMISIPTYVLLYLAATGKTGQESAAKYFLLSVLSSAILLLGMSYLYGLAGSTNINAILMALTAANKVALSPLAVLAMTLVIGGLAFRLAAVPFHFYAPDVYQGGPTGVVAQLAVIAKLVGFVVLAKLLGFTQSPFSNQPFPNSTQLPVLILLLAGVTMTLGNVLALLQDNLKRIMAYSGIAHAGYMLLGVVTATAYAPAELTLVPRSGNGLDAVLFYLIGYSLMTLAFFAMLAYLNSSSRTVETVDDLAGVGQSNPVAAAILFVSLLSLIGIPLTAGFYGKLNLFLALYDAPTTTGLGNTYKVLTVIAAVNAAIAAVYYLRILGVIYLRSPLGPTEPARGFGPMLAGLICTLGTLAIGIYPQPVLNLAQAAAPHGAVGVAAAATK